MLNRPRNRRRHINFDCNIKMKVIAKVINITAIVVELFSRSKSHLSWMSFSAFFSSYIYITLILFSVTVNLIYGLNSSLLRLIQNKIHRHTPLSLLLFSYSPQTYQQKRKTLSTETTISRSRCTTNNEISSTSFIFTFEN